ncbi:Rof/RNase P-like protein [Amylocarpus encephaloides]|uniref:Ribonuclease P protein subunit n=1 Tax=Amylocarpus encephaloides TaxID=45428 RepID=A0A9P8C7H3_9HELO|nr:Rof/RNase P-like protein [Amylocarpus encephaloides]
MTPITPRSKPPENKYTIASTLLSRAHSPTRAAVIHTERILQRPLYLKPTSPTLTPSAQALRRQKRTSSLLRKKSRKPKPLSARQKRQLGLYTLEKSAQKYNIYEPLHKMWLGYMQEILDVDRGLPITSGSAAKLCSCDYHGALLQVVRSRCVGRVGVGGIVVKDTKHAFEIITKSDEVKLLPKEGTVFTFTIPIPSSKNAELEDRREEKKQGEKKDLVFELHGDQFIYRAADRANRKFKLHFLKDL